MNYKDDIYKDDSMKTDAEKDQRNREVLAHAWLFGPGSGGGTLVSKLAEYAQYLRREWEESTEYGTGGEEAARAWIEANEHAYTVTSVVAVNNLAVPLAEYVRYCRSKAVKPAGTPEPPPAPFSITGPGKYETVGQAQVTIEALPDESLYAQRTELTLRWYAPEAWFAYGDDGKAWQITVAGLMKRRPDYDLAKTL